jgi:hypothetical protein
VPPPPVGPGAYVERGPALPHSYGEDRLVALPRDPRCIFVYWETTPGNRRRNVAQRCGKGAASEVWVLRVTATHPPRGEEEFFDVPIDPQKGNWYLAVEPDSCYRVAIGLILPSDGFTSLVASDELVTPRDNFVSTRGKAPTEGSTPVERLGLTGSVRPQPGALSSGSLLGTAPHPSVASEAGVQGDTAWKRGR